MLFYVTTFWLGLDLFTWSEGPNSRSNETGINIMIFILLFVENWLLYDMIHDFSELLRTGSNPADINWFLSHTGKELVSFWSKQFT